MYNYDHIGQNLVTRVNVTEFRRHLAQYIATVRYGGDYVCIRRKGMEPVYLVSRADMDLICDRTDDIEAGPKDENGHRSGRGLMYWVRQQFKQDRKKA